MRAYHSPSFRAAAASVAQDILDANVNHWGMHNGIPTGTGNVVRAGTCVARRVKAIEDCAFRIDEIMEQFGPDDDFRAAPRKVRALMYTAWKALSEASLIMANAHYDEETDVWSALSVNDRIERLAKLGRDVLRCGQLGHSAAMKEKLERLKTKLRADEQIADALGVDAFAPNFLQDLAGVRAFVMLAASATQT